MDPPRTCKFVPSYKVFREKPNWDFKNIHYVFSTPIHNRIKDDDKVFNMTKNAYINCLGREAQELLDLSAQSHALVVPKVRNVEQTLRSWDQKQPTNYLDDDFRYSQKFLDLQYGHVFEDGIATDDEISNAIDWSRGVGFPSNEQGFVEKSELINDVSWVEWFDRFEEALQSGNLRWYTPIWVVKPKKEVLSMEDILRDKIRLFQIPPLHFVWLQHKYGKRSCDKLKNFKWSYYGFNPYRGGFDSLARKLLTKRWRLCYDISGWDKFLPCLAEVYDVIKKNMNLTSEELKEFEFVERNVVMPFLRMPNGQVFTKNFGNPSGSGTTTRDNILAHILIFTHALVKAYKKHMGKYPSHSLIADQVVAIFGDDNVASVDEEFKLMCDYDFLSEHFKSYGMKLKFLVGGENLALDQLSFLGAHFVEKDGVWLPKYDVQRLAFSAVYDNTGENCSIGQFAGKLRTLAFMSYPTNHFTLFQKAYHNFINKNIKHYKTGDLEFDSMVNLGSIDPASVNFHYTEHEV